MPTEQDSAGTPAGLAWNFASPSRPRLLQEFRGAQKGVAVAGLQKIHVCVLSHCSCVRLFVTPWAVACLAPLSMRFPR